jgi:thiamine biosynthesis lipoprotein
MVFSAKFLTFMIPLLIFLLLQQKDQQQFTIHGFAQGTDYTVKYFAEREVIAKQEVDSILLKIDSSMSLYKPYSLINKFNAAAEGQMIDSQFKKVIQKSFEINKDTKGKFDVTVAPLVQAWGFGPKPINNYPDKFAIKQLLKLVGMDKLKLEGSYLKKKKPGLQIDLNGIAQGYSVDVVADYLYKRGIKSFVVEIGGELRIEGLKPDGTARKIGIEGPPADPAAEPDIKHVISIEKGAVTTSGNYRKWLQKGSKKIAHLIDPKTGYPLNNQMISVTIYARDAMTADGYDNAIMAMGVQEALDFIEAREDMQAYLIYHRKDGSIADTLTSGFKKMMIQ